MNGGKAADSVYKTGQGGTPLFYLYRYVSLQSVRFLLRVDFKTGTDFVHSDL